MELNSAVPALKNRQITGFATAGSYPAPNVLEAAAGTPIRILSLTDEQVAMTKRAKLVIPAGTYPGVDQDITTTTLPVGAYTTEAMDPQTAYQLTKTFWEQKEKMGKENPWWDAVVFENIATLGAKLHPGAAKYYTEAGVPIPGHLK